MGIATQLKEVDRGFVKATAIPALATKPVVIGGKAIPKGARLSGPENAYRNGTMYSSYTAASFARIWDMAERRHVNLEGVLSWSFEFENQPWFGLSAIGEQRACPCRCSTSFACSPTRSRPAGAVSDAQVPLDIAMTQGVRGPQTSAPSRPGWRTGALRS